MMNLDELFSNFYEFLRENKGLNSGTEEKVKNVSESLDSFKNLFDSNFRNLASSVNMFIESYKAVVCEKNALDKELETAKNENASLLKLQMTGRSRCQPSITARHALHRIRKARQRAKAAERRLKQDAPIAVKRLTLIHHTAQNAPSLSEICRLH